ncbi:MAG: hypothetical protein A2Y07_10010 [Planctomycetes bacterium GWF2_50_10]|nr:MAG: hypothetical protein A2Y07_10010 [Planctomycetes bacterium GWF2_50_10]
MGKSDSFAVNREKSETNCKCIKICSVETLYLALSGLCTFGLFDPGLRFAPPWAIKWCPFRAEIKTFSTEQKN